jgi:hypothetical protein
MTAARNRSYVPQPCFGFAQPSSMFNTWARGMVPLTSQVRDGAIYKPLAVEDLSIADYLAISDTLSSPGFEITPQTTVPTEKQVIGCCMDLDGYAVWGKRSFIADNVTWYI